LLRPSFEVRWVNRFPLYLVIPLPLVPNHNTPFLSFIAHLIKSAPSPSLSEKYVKYFVRNKPDIYVDFRLSKDFFNYNVEKVDLKLYNSLNIEIYAVSKAISAENLKIIIPNKNYPPGKYSIELMAGGENLLLDNKYSFKISN